MPSRAVATQSFERRLSAASSGRPEGRLMAERAHCPTATEWPVSRPSSVFGDPRRNGHGGLVEWLRSRAGVPVRASDGPRVRLDANLFSAARPMGHSRLEPARESSATGICDSKAPMPWRQVSRGGAVPVLKMPCRSRPRIRKATRRGPRYRGTRETAIAVPGTRLADGAPTVHDGLDLAQFSLLAMRLP